MASRLATLLGVIALAFAGAALAATPDLRIQFAEKIALGATPGHTSFDAYGRRFALTLEDNSRLLAGLPAAQKSGLPAYPLLRGVLDGAPGSWVRLARVAQGLEGAIWDGHDLYVVTRHAGIAANLALPLAAGPSDTVIYRLSDAQGGLPAQFCGLETDLPRSPVTPSALKQYTNVVADLRAAALANPTDQLDVALVADTEFQSSNGTTTRDLLLARLNTVDGIFSEQVGVAISPAAVRLAPVPNPLGATNAQTLLGDLGAYRSGDDELRAAGITHLVTGKDLDGDTAGIAYLDSLCDRHDGVSVSYALSGEFYGALIMAHELGHNFGARHDGAAGSACESVPASYLMWPSVTGSAQFSQCSLDAMRPVVQRARAESCIRPASYADVGVSLPASPVMMDALTEFSLPVTVRSLGTITATHARATIALPSQLAYRSAAVTGGACTLSGQTVDCDFGDLAAGESRVVDLRLVSSELGSYGVQASVSADADRYAGNNVANVVVGLQSAIDLGVTLHVSAAQLYQTDAVDFTIDIASTRTQAAHGGRLTFDHFPVQIVSIDAGPHSCAASASNGWSLECDLADIAGGATSRIVVHGRATQTGDFGVNTQVVVAGDGDFRNNTATLSLHVLAEREVKTGVSIAYLNAVIGTPYELTYTLTAAGRLPSDAVKFRLSALYAGVIDSVVPSAGTCAATPAMQYDCAFGAVNPGDVRTITVRFHMTAAASSTLSGYTRYTDGTVEQAASINTWIYANQRVDVAAELPGATSFEEGQTVNQSFYVRSLGIDPAQDVVATLEVPAPARITRVVVSPGAGAGFQCSLETPQSARCTGAFSSPNPGESRYFSYEITSDTALTGQETLTVSATNDGDASNNSLRRAVTVRQGYDVGLTARTLELLVDVNDTASIDFNVTTGHNPVANVTLGADWASVITVDSIRIDGADCALVDGHCALGDLPGNASVPVSIRFRASAEGEGDFYVRAEAAYDSTRANNAVDLHYIAQQRTDVQLAVPASFESIAGTLVTLPTIWVRTAATARNVVVSIPLPSFATLQSVSASGGGACTGPTTLECAFPSIQAGGQVGIDVHLSAPAPGKFDSNITLTAGNDSTPGNNAATLSMNVTRDTPVSGGGTGGGTGSGSGGGGGGRMEWLALAFLCLLALRRATRDALPRPARIVRH